MGVGRVVYASTIWVYGNGAANGNGHGALDEDAPLRLPEHFYTATKIAGEMYCRAYRELYGLEETILRFGIPYGPRMRPAAVLARFVARALAGEPLAIAGDGSQSRQFVYVEDLAEGVVAALTPAAVGRIYNLVGNERVSVRGVADTVRELVADVPIVHVAGRTADLNPIEILGARAARELDWLPVTSSSRAPAATWTGSRPPASSSARRSRCPSRPGRAALAESPVDGPLGRAPKTPTRASTRGGGGGLGRHGEVLRLARPERAPQGDGELLRVARHLGEPEALEGGVVQPQVPASPQP